MYSLTRLRKAQTQVGRRMVGKAARSPMLTGPQNQMSQDNAGWMARPDASCAPIQDLDPDSPTFGDVFWMLDFDPLT